MKDKIISCDWGTTAFRLKLLDKESGKFLGGIKSNQGIASTHREWTKQHTQRRVSFFQAYLLSQVQLLSQKVGKLLSQTPIYISGMASSSIGMYELPYANLPLRLSGEGLVTHTITGDDNFPHDIYLISGVKTDEDVMRGEEVEIIGLSKYIPKSSFVGIFPGTHSKHIEVREREIVGFQTYMTGEVFQILSEHSILHASLSKPEEDIDMLAFEKGVEANKRVPILHGLFTTRANELIHSTSPTYNYAYLSGLLIGQELEVLRKSALPIFLCGGSSLSFLYSRALEILNLDQEVHIVSAEKVEESVCIGHLSLAN